LQDGFGNKIQYHGIPTGAKGKAQTSAKMSSPANLAPALSYEYEKIMQNTQAATSSSMLPQTEP